jgi:8-oxo-dGTP pyrophosphatase MutT (NUDIX family)
MENATILENILQEMASKLPKFPDGRIDYSDSDRAPVLNCFVKFEDKILILKRSGQVRAYQGKWNSVGGYLDEFCPVEEKVREELREELGIENDLIGEIKIGEAYEMVDEEIRKTWIIFPVLAELNKEPEIRLDWEHTECRWIFPAELKNFDIIRNLDKALEKVW